jgi:peptidoglycan/LPS O-acetylase OafA/YrhL
MRFKSIDFLRGIAIILVFFRHIVIEPKLIKIGWIGVDLFFVLSGFLVSNLLFQEYKNTGKIRPIRFLVRRGLKIYPLFYLLTILTFCIRLYINPNGYASFKIAFWNEVLFIQNYYYYNAALNVHTWSLAVEEHFYIVLISLFYIFTKLKVLNNPILFNVLTSIILFLCLNMRINIVLPLDKINFGHYLLQTHLRFDTLWVGVFIAYHYNYNSLKFNQLFGNGGWLWLILIAILIPACYGLESKFLATFGLTLIAMCFGGALAALVANEQSENLLIGVFGRKIVDAVAKIGIYSYAIYLFHFIVLFYISPMKPETIYNSFAGRVQVIFSLLLIIGIGVVMTEWIEKPILKWRDKVMR